MNKHLDLDVPLPSAFSQSQKMKNAINEFTIWLYLDQNEVPDHVMEADCETGGNMFVQTKENELELTFHQKEQTVH